MNKPVYLGKLIFQINEIAIYQFSHDYVKLEYEKGTIMLYGYRYLHSLHEYIRYTADIAKYVKTRFDTSC